MRSGDTELGSKPAKNPKRVAAGKLNRSKRKGLTPAGRERLRQAALRTRPWLRSTGPTSAAGKAQAVRNGKRRQLGPLSVRELRAALLDVYSTMRAMTVTRAGVTDRCGPARGRLSS
jgi:hypothetical protein